MSDADKLRDAIAKQKSALSELEREAGALLRSDLAVENEALKEEAAKLRGALAEANESLKAASARNAALKNALFEHAFAERARILDASLKKSDAYFKASAGGEVNRLAALERDVASKAGLLAGELKKYRVDASDELYAQLSGLAARAGAVLTEARDRLAKETGAFNEYSAERFGKLKEEQLTDDTIAAVGRKNSIETFVGGNLINKLGILFVILGIIAVSRFTFLRLPDTFKGMMMFAVSGLFLLAGELLNRKKPNIFSLGVTSGGVAGLYVSLSVSYFALGIISMYPALALCVLMTVGAFVLSQRYNSQSIAAFALFGGYIPIISISGGVALVYGAMVYFIMLNLLALTVSFYKRWKVSMLLGFALNLAGTVYVVYSMSDLAPISPPGLPGLGFPHFATVLYVLFSFAVYTLIPVISCCRRRQPLGRFDIAVLALNTFLSALIMYALFYAFSLSEYNGAMALAFAAAYVGLGRFMDGRFAEEKRGAALFYLTGLAFVVLVVPMQFGAEWLSLGWLAQGVALAAYGILREDRAFKRAGLVIGALCLAAFAAFDVLLQIDNLFAYKYLAVTLGSVVILAAMAHKRSLSRLPELIYKYAVLLNGWFYTVYLCAQTGPQLYRFFPDVGLGYYHLAGALAVASTFAYAFMLPRLPLLADKGVKIMSVALSAVGMLFSAALTGSGGAMFRGDAPFPVAVIGSAVLIALCALAVFSLREMLMFFVLEVKLPAEWMPFVLSAYFLMTLTQNLVAQYGLSLTSMIISVIYVAASFAWIVFGFVKRYPFMRRLGLGLSMLAVAKLFFIDLPELTQGYKIISYFAFGLTLLAISFVYQYFSKKIMPKGGGDSNEA